MISEHINLSTGPVNISREVRKALSAPAISHRSGEFRRLFDNTSELLCRTFSVHQAFIMSGSGTLANEAMLYQVKMLGSKGLILSNGEFGSRLLRQAERISLDFVKYELGWGQPFNLPEITAMFQAGDIKWLLFCHCETSTGVLNDLDALAALCSSCNCLCFVDCISAAGAMPLNLSKVSMATASSGKGLAACSGLALILSNISPQTDNSMPLYYDIAYYSDKCQVPFTISSNLIDALYVSMQQKMTAHQADLVHQYCHQFFAILNAYDLAPYGNPGSRVFTIILPEDRLNAFIHQMAGKQVALSHESEYLKKRTWAQLAVFGYYQEEQLNYAANALEQSIQSVLDVKKHQELFK